MRGSDELRGGARIAKRSNWSQEKLAKKVTVMAKAVCVCVGGALLCGL